MTSTIVEYFRWPAPAPARVVTPCQVESPQLWFSARPAELEQAKEFCRACPIREHCLAGAIERAEPHGVWGGEIFDNGVIIEHKRPRGRPRKHPREADLVRCIPVNRDALVPLPDRVVH